MADPDVAELRRLAEAAIQTTVVWSVDSRVPGDYARFIAATGPDVVLALLDERQGLLDRIAELEARVGSDRVEAAWIIARAPKPVRAMVAEGWRPVMHECVEPPQWNHDHNGAVDLTDDDIAWFHDASPAAPAGEQPDSAPAAEEKLTDLMAALETSVREAKEARKRHPQPADAGSAPESGDTP